ncbi:phage major capsid protein [Tumebacillus permanentifrigoris]|uniref:HK97 family phage major capsid protein n=1 Tax=Tumebacillus permanentifrigoris TaxID=378543 RepID=A0A316D2Y3_9BACL|nr:phage major capsid protein [Tumebacillus permanentifrigoris]PWK05307.1 HK97 family phage major capsid protein [Tumebacillus permanentifrigoris]
MSTLFTMKENLNIIGAQLTSVSAELRSKAGDPAVKIDDIRTLQGQQKEVEERFNILKAEIEKQESAERSKLRAQNPVTFADSDGQRMIAAKADMIRCAILGREPSEETRNLLGAIPKPNASGGDKFLPSNMSKELITEPLTKNPLREHIGTTVIVGLEMPRISFTLDDDDFITDADTAKEIMSSGDKVSFGRNKFKVKARISDSVLNGTDVDLVNTVENALRSGLAAKEKKTALATAPKPSEDHMSFYSATGGGIKRVAGATLLMAINAAFADLHEDYRENAKVCMRYSDYRAMLNELANGNASFFTAPPEQVLGIPPIWCDGATEPIVGDFNYYHLNYEGEPVYDTDKDVDKGEFLFVLTGWFDQQLKLKSAFRIAEVSASQP